MKEENPLFREPEGSASVWRYMNFSQFASLIVRGQLFFPKFELLGDEFEGTWANTLPQSIEESSFAKVIKRNRKNIDGLVQSFEIFRKDIYLTSCVSCWHQNEYESAAMWNSYLKTNEGIAIRTTFKHLIASFGESQKRLMVGMITYADYDKDVLFYNPFTPFLTKLKSYEHENELRLIYSSDVKQGEEHTFKGGMYVDVDLTKMIEKIYISPNSPEWFKDLMKGFLDKFNLNFEIISSSLKDRSLK